MSATLTMEDVRVRVPTPLDLITAPVAKVTDLTMMAITVQVHAAPVLVSGVVMMPICRYK